MPLSPQSAAWRAVGVGRTEGRFDWLAGAIALIAPQFCLLPVCPQVVEELIKEAALLASLRHPNIVFVYGLVLGGGPASGSGESPGEDAGHAYFAPAPEEGHDEGGAQHTEAPAAAEEAPAGNAHHHGIGRSDSSDGSASSTAGASHTSHHSSRRRSLGSYPSQELAALKAGLAPGQAIDAVSLAVELAGKCTMGPGLIRPPALVTEYMAGGSLRGALSRRADFLRSPVTRVKLALDCARGCEYLHSKRIVHFDLKAGNLLVGLREKVRSSPCSGV